MHYVCMFMYMNVFSLELTHTLQMQRNFQQTVHIIFLFLYGHALIILFLNDLYRPHMKRQI